MQRLGCCFTVCDKREANESPAGIAPVRLLPCEVAAGNHSHASISVKLDGYRFVSAFCSDIEPDAKAAGGTPIAVAVAQDLVGDVELDAVKPAVFLDMGFVVVGGDRHILDRNRHLGRG